MVSFFSDSFSLILGVFFGIIGNIIAAIAFRDSKENYSKLTKLLILIVVLPLFVGLILIPTLNSQLVTPWAEIALGMLLVERDN